MPRFVPDPRLAAALLAAAASGGCATMPPPPPAGATSFTAARYVCDDSVRFTARFDAMADMASLIVDPDLRLTLAGRQSGSGIWYESGGWVLRGKGDTATLSRPDGRVSRCHVAGEETPAAAPHRA